MPILSKSTPKYRKHRASGQAIVTLGGKDFYLGPHGTEASWREYDRIIAEWLQNGRTIPEPDAGLTVVELFAAYKRFAVKYYRKNGKVTREVGLRAGGCHINRPFRLWTRRGRTSGGVGGFTAPAGSRPVPTSRRRGQ